MTTNKISKKCDTKRIVTKHGCKRVRKATHKSSERFIDYICHRPHVVAQMEGVDMHKLCIGMKNLLLLDGSETQEMVVVQDDCDILTKPFQS